MKLNAKSGLGATILPWAAAALAAATLMAAQTCRAQDTNTMAPSGGTSSDSNPFINYFANWFTRATQIQSEQPHWITPLVTVTPRLEQEIRYDQFWESYPGEHQLDVYGGMKGLELIPFQNVEFIIGVPAYEAENLQPRKYGWSDESFLIKYRLLSANEDNGDYILTAFMGVTAPDGGANYTTKHFVYAPTIAGGKGWGDFDIQSTLGFTIPDDGASHAHAGETIPFNTTFQYRLFHYFSPEFEANYTWWANGTREGRSQVFLTPGLLIGRIPISGRVGLTIGAGVQIAASDNPVYHRNVIFTARMPF